MFDVTSNFKKLQLVDGPGVSDYSRAKCRKDKLIKQKKTILTAIDNEPLGFKKLHANKTPFTLTILEPNTQLYELVEKLFKNNDVFDKNFVVQKIARVYNSRVLAIYEAKRNQNVWNEEILFHGTPIDNLDGILVNNFDKSKTKRGKHGCGISFNMYPYHSTFYCKNTGPKVLIVTRVLVRKYHIGAENMRVPCKGFDATTNSNGQILVKYEDHSFYPEFVVMYEKKKFSI